MYIYLSKKNGYILKKQENKLTKLMLSAYLTPAL